MKKYQTIIRSVVLSLVLLVVGIPFGNMANADDIQQGAKTPSIRDTMWQVVPEEQSARIAIVDEETPLPSINGKEIIWVDGSFLSKGEPRVTRYLGAHALNGIPIVFVGTGITPLCKELGLPYEMTEDERGNPVEIPAVVSVLKVYPQQMVDGKPCGVSMMVIGENNIPEVVRRAHERATELVTNELPTGVACTKKATVDELSQIASEGVGMGITSAYWAYVWQGELNYAYPDKGQLNVIRTWYKLQDDGSSSYDWRNLEVSMQIVPGKVVYSSNWRNDDTWVSIDVNERKSHYQLIDYGPTTTSGQSSITIDVGVQAGQDGAAVSASMSWGYSVSDVVVQDSSNFSTELFYLQHLIDQSKTVGQYTYLHKPGLTYRLNNGELSELRQQYRAKFAKPVMYWWDTWTGPWQAVTTYNT
ncbi:MAG: hypothetical protein ABIN58_01175 [candidate division WOR-3 bacterium]